MLCSFNKAFSWKFRTLDNIISCFQHIHTDTIIHTVNLLYTVGIKNLLSLLSIILFPISTKKVEVGKSHPSSWALSLWHLSTFQSMHPLLFFIFDRSFLTYCWFKITFFVLNMYITVTILPDVKEFKRIIKILDSYQWILDSY